MPTRITIGGVDLEDLFAPDIIGDGPTVPGLTVGGVPIKFADISYGLLGADTEITEGGVDIKNKWAAAGTAYYVSLDGFPALIEDFATGSSAPVSSAASFTFHPDGTYSTTPFSTGSWATATSSPGASYDLRVTKLPGSNAGGTMTGVLEDPYSGPVQVQINEDRTVDLQNVRMSSGSNRAIRILFLEIVRRSDGIVVASVTTSLEAESDIS